MCKGMLPIDWCPDRFNEVFNFRHIRIIVHLSTRLDDRIREINGEEDVDDVPHYLVE